MEKAFHVQLIAYGPLLQNAGIQFRTKEKHLAAGIPKDEQPWRLFISCKTLDTPDVLRDVLPLLKRNSLSFLLVKDQLVQYQLNSGAFGEEEVGKVISIFPDSTSQAVQIAMELCVVTNRYRGPVVMNALRLGQLVYAQTAKAHNEGKYDGLNRFFKVRDRVPFAIPAQFRMKGKRKIIIGHHYLPVQLLGTSPKGDIIKAINLKNLAFNWCLLKQGKPGALDDHFGRDMKDRLLWQQRVLDRIAGTVLTPAVIDYFEQDDSVYLVMEYAEGQPLGLVISNALKEKTWKALNVCRKKELMGYMCDAVDLVISVHHKEVVHRDITDSNFLVAGDGRLCIIDFELSYDMQTHQPSPPFVLGTFGYAAPEQLKYAVPDYKEDVYSIGALLCYLFSGSQPTAFLQHCSSSVLREKLGGLIGNLEMAALITRCLQSRRVDRPGMQDVKNILRTYHSTLN